tara:strand:- start:358 stop:528 length:171 start_codon:yes stop_codon:yes gene_type:complete
MKDKITQLRNELKQLHKPKKVHIDRKPIEFTKLPYIKKEKKTYFEEEINNNILEKL